ncbi:MAG: efflux RND transporter periplasmic adaptor subunit [Candidatus Omnitrophica bacterium]|nr:efflux RND transporter periplasmic adaptor subunit [Candidatus Omnitrophota bacterium]
MRINKYFFPNFVLDRLLAVYTKFAQRVASLGFAETLRGSILAGNRNRRQILHFSFLCAPNRRAIHGNAKFGIIIVTVLVLAVVIFFGVKKFQNTNAEKNNIKIIHAKNGTIQTVISTTGTVLPKNRLELKPPVNGRVEKILVAEGDKVKAGQIVAWMSSTDRAALLDAARGQSKESLDYWNEVYKPIALVAPIDGEVIVATMQPGQTVTASDAVIVLSDQLIFRAQVDETDIGKIAVGQEANVTMDAYPDAKIESEVDHIYYESKTVNNVTVYSVDLKAEELPDFCRSGMNVNVDFRDKYKEDILTLPVDAVQKDKEGSFVMVKDEETGKSVRRAITTGITDDSVIEIVSGLSSDDEVVIKKKKFSLPKNAGGTNPFMPARPGGGGGGGRH